MTQVVFSQRFEDQNFIQSVEELRFKELANIRHNILLYTFKGMEPVIFRLVSDIKAHCRHFGLQTISTQIPGHNNNRISEIDSSPL